MTHTANAELSELGAKFGITECSVSYIPEVNELERQHRGSRHGKKVKCLESLFFLVSK